MHEQDFRILEGQDITLPELGRELENIGRTIADSTGEIKRVIAHLPNFESDTDTFVATYRLNHQQDFIDATFTALKSDRARLKEVPVHVELISYISKSKIDCYLKRKVDQNIDFVFLLRNYIGVSIDDLL